MRPDDFETGFTLIEIIVVMAMSSIIMAAVTAAALNMQSTSLSIDQRTNMAMNARGAMHMIEENIRLMGFNPAKDMNRSDIVVTATAPYLAFKRNNPSNPNKNDDVYIGLKHAGDMDGNNSFKWHARLKGRDGFADHGATSLVIDANNVADDIEALRFAYAYDDDGDGNVEMANGKIIWAVDSDGDGRLDQKADGKSLSPAVDISAIRAVRVWLLVRSRHPVRGTGETGSFILGGQTYSPDDNFARMMLTTTVRCRNMF